MDDFGSLSLNDRKIIVGVDFGTTYSGLAWAETRRPDHIHIIDTWPSDIATPDGASSAKVPSEIRYVKDGYEWGFQIPSIVDRHQWFKLALDGQSSQSSSRVPNDPANRDPEQLLEDYMTALGNHLLYTLEQKLGVAFRNIPLEYVVTVPAIWNEVAVEKTLSACRAAGFKTEVPISLVAEPEAAAIYGLNGLDPESLKVGDSFVVCDAGGGTVDLISYTVTKLSPTLEIEEAAPGSGAHCGSTFLNRRFGNFLTHKLGQEDGWDADTLAEAMERFETVIKKQYSPSTYSESSYNIPVAGLSNNEILGIRRGRFSMKPSDMKEIFEPIVKQVIELVWGQISATRVKVKAVLLIGGFGQNNYLKERLRNALINDINKIEVIQPPHAWTAVVRGAVMKGIANYDKKLTAVNIGQRTARKHYGVWLETSYDETLHGEETRIWNDFHGEWGAPYMHWIIRRGDHVDESNRSVIDFSREVPFERGLPKDYTLRIYCDSISPSAPTQKNDNVIELAELRTSLVDFQDRFQILTGKDNKKYYCFEGAIEAKYTSASTEYSLVFEGKRYATVTAEYV